MKESIQKTILRLLVEHNQESYSVSEIAKLIKKDYKNTYEAIKNLPSINIRKSAGANQVSFAFAFSELLFQVEIQRRHEILKDKNLNILCNDLSKVNSQFILLLFGSRAKKTNRKDSDYDLLLISDNPKIVEQKLSLYPLNIHVNTFSLQEFKDMLLSKEFTVVSEAVKNNVILFGIEDYYRFVENAR
ncbi:MAG: nucleotidyltransferase domain-containing protein [Candidatus Woesearchaeota archaeon]